MRILFLGKFKIVKSIMLGKLEGEQGEKQDYIIEHSRGWNLVES